MWHSIKSIKSSKCLFWHTPVQHGCRSADKSGKERCSEEDRHFDTVHSLQRCSRCPRPQYSILLSIRSRKLGISWNKRQQSIIAGQRHTAGRLSKSWWKRSPGSDRCQQQNGSECGISDIFRQHLRHVLLPSGCCLRDKRATCHTKQTPSREKCQLHRPLVSIP